MHSPARSSDRPSTSLSTPFATWRSLVVTSHRVARAATSAALLSSFIVLANCGDDSVLNSAPQPPKGIVVLDGFIQPGLTLVADTGSATSRIAFAPGTEFDASEFSLLRDTVLAVSSRSAGDLLYVADVKSGTMRRLQLPARSNPSRARLFNGTGGQSLVGVALRDSSSVALVAFAGAGAPTITRLANAGTSPTDVFQYDNATWVIDGNANCKTTYAVLGDVRLIRIPNTGTARDTTLLPGMRGSGASAIVAGDVAYVSAGGDANFASFPYALIASGRVTKVDLKNKRVLAQRAMPSNSYGAGVKLGADGFLYVSLYEDLDSFRDRIVKLRADDLTTVGGTGASAWVKLTGSTGAEVYCGSAVADALGRLHCILNGAGSATSLLVFDLAGRETRRVSAGQGGVDMALR